MKQMQWTLIAGVTLALAAAGCDDTLRGIQKDTKENSETAKRVAEETGLDEAAKKAGEKAQQAAEAAKHEVEKIAENLGNRDQPSIPAVDRRADDDGDVDRSLGKAKAKLEDAGRQIGQDAKALTILADVKQALMRDDSVDASHIDVDVDGSERVVVLRGSVPTSAQKAQAQIVARARAKDYSVSNKLAVRP